jgi:hypothetical protein
MHQLCRRDLVDGSGRRRDVVDHLLRHRHLVRLVNDMDLTMLVHHQYVVGNYLFRFPHLLVEEHLDVQQNRDALNLDERLPFLDEVLPFPLVVVVDVELRHLSRTDCYQDVADVELRYLMRMDCFQDGVQLAHLALHQLQVLLLPLSRLPLLHPVPTFQHHEMP